MDTQPFRTYVKIGSERIGFVVWSKTHWTAYRFAGAPPIGKAATKEEAIAMVHRFTAELRGTL
jgi:hypothetical protein